MKEEWLKKIRVVSKDRTKDENWPSLVLDLEFYNLDRMNNLTDEDFDYLFSKLKDCYKQRLNT